MSKKNDYKVREFKVKINFHTYGCITKKEMEENVFVYLITCTKGAKPCLILDEKIVKGPECKGNEFYIRRKTECIALNGQERADYIDRHFYRDNP